VNRAREEAITKANLDLAEANAVKVAVRAAALLTK